MIQPDEIRKKAANLFPKFLRAWLDGNADFFPYVLRSNRSLDPIDPAAAIEQVQLLRDGSKEVRGFGYSIEWEERKSRAFGLNRFPQRIQFDTQDDYVRFVGRQAEFAGFASAVTRLRAEFPELEGWLRSHRQLLIESASETEGLLHVLRYFREHPRPGWFARELPLPVDTKFIERHQRILRDWFDLVLPPHTIRSDESHFERRYGLSYAETHVPVRLLDLALQAELKCPWSELSLPIAALGSLAARAVRAIVVENKVNLLTLPCLSRTIALGGLGCAVIDLRYVSWLATTPLTYWGDLDVEGFEILSSLRSVFPQTRSILMDTRALERWRSLAGPGTSRHRDIPPHLTAGESEAFLFCRDNNLRLEQERIPNVEALEMLIQNCNSAADETTMLR